MLRLHPPADDNQRYLSSERVRAIKPILQSHVNGVHRLRKSESLLLLTLLDTRIHDLSYHEYCSICTYSNAGFFDPVRVETSAVVV